MPDLDAVIDISHHNGSAIDLQKAKAAGKLAVIHKATQGTGYRDPMYGANRGKALAAGLLFGAYHFGTGADGAAQADFFLQTVGPQPGELLTLDFEANNAGPSMTLDQAKAFITRVQTAIGKWPVLYAGSYLREQLHGQADAVLANCPLWLAQYGPTAVLPPGWSKWTLWQYTDGTVGHPPEVPGVGHCDRERFSGSEEELRALWVATSAA